jgi:hypothetical protein
MRFIRAFWGDLTVNNQKYIDELRKAAVDKSLNEIVYVWGEINYKFISSLGYETVLVSPNPTEFNSKNILDGVNFFYHKYKALELGIKDFGEVIFLDWDVNYIKPIDENFYNKIKENNSSLQIPLYTFPIKGYLDYINMRNPKLTQDWKDFTKNHYDSLMDYSYFLGGNLCAPCTCFIYCSDIKIIEDFLELSKELNTFSDEGVWGEWGRKTYDLDGWILNHEPLVCNAKYDWHFNQKELNEYMSNIINKDLYFIHQ